MMWPPQRVKMVSTPSFFSALATKCPPDTTLASRLFRCRVSSAVVALGGFEMGFAVAIGSPNAWIEAEPQVTRGGAASFSGIRGFAQDDSAAAFSFIL